jgi:hypothetical protein
LGIPCTAGGSVQGTGTQSDKAERRRTHLRQVQCVRRSFAYLRRERDASPRWPPDNSLLSTAANHDRWAAVEDRTAATAPARQAFRDRFLTEAQERFGDLPADELARRAEHLRKAYYARLALRSAQARRARKTGPTSDAA